MDSRYDEMVWNMGHSTLASWCITRFLNELSYVFNVFVPPRKRYMWRGLWTKGLLGTTMVKWTLLRERCHIVSLMFFNKRDISIVTNTWLVYVVVEWTLSRKKCDISPYHLLAKETCLDDNMVTCLLETNMLYCSFDLIAMFTLCQLIWFKRLNYATNIWSWSHILLMQETIDYTIQLD